MTLRSLTLNCFPPDKGTMKLLIVAALVGLCLAQHNPNTKHNRTSIVHLFEWRWADIAEECERYLAPNGYGGVQISPPSESVVVSNPWQPWWQRYQPVSYNLCSRSGTEAELKDMITRCNNVGVNIYPLVESSVLTFWDSRLYKIATGLMLAHPYGVTRVMSSYHWDRHFVNGKDQNDWMGPPSNANGSTKPVPINPDSTCGDKWICEHRWRQIRNMVIYRNVVNGQPLSNWWDNGNNQIAFSRGSKGFIVINNDDWALNVTLNTGLPKGTYCDVISGDKSGGSCTGKEVSVDADGRATFSISNTDEDPFIAIHADSKL
uniref:alpha-amylase n=1 Tax=Sinocyclocheilus rhinocerous TaxID=307959 RepID=A0A673KDS1_9TELE